MDRSMFSSAELQIARERCLKFQGTAKININQISLPSEYKPNNVERLRRIFNSEDCDRLSLPNHVVGTISGANLISALSGSQLNANSLMSQPSDSYISLEFPAGQVTCLHGQHRLRAGKEFLAPYDQWWTVDLYLDDISRALETELTDEYANEATPTDGDVYRKVRQYQYEASARFEERWLSRLTENKQKRMRQLSQPENSSIRSAFDSLLPIPGLWNGMSIGNLPRVIAVKCDEEIIHYLRFIKDFWTSLVEHDQSRMDKIDCMTVEKLQLLVPGGLDRTKVKGLVLSGEAFPKFNQSERESIWRILHRRDEIVPSLHTFFKDLSYLEVTSGCLGRLVDLAALRKRTMRSAMKQIYDPLRDARGRYQIQVSETEFRSCFGTVEEGRESAYRQLWLFTFRHYLHMPKARQKKKQHAKTKFREADDGVVHRMASLALQLGFDSPQIQRLINDSPDRRLALEALLKARDHNQYRFDSIDTLINRIVACFNEAVPVEVRDPHASAFFSTIPRQSRCGKPSLETHEQEQKFLFLDQIESPLSDDFVSALFVRRCVYFAFFGRPSEAPPHPIDDEDHSTRHSSPHPPPSPLFVPEEYTLLDIHPVTTENVDHETNRPGPQHRDSRHWERRVEIDAEDELEPTQPENMVEEEEVGGNTITTDPLSDNILIAEPTQTGDPAEEDQNEAEIEDHTVAPETIISEPSLPGHTEYNAEFNGSTEVNAPPQEVDEGAALIPQENDHLVERLPRHLIESHHAALGASRQRAVRRFRPLGLKRSAIAKRQAEAQTCLSGKDHHLSRVDVKRGNQFKPGPNLGVEQLPPTVDLPIQTPREVVAEERTQTIVYLEERLATSEPAVVNPINSSPIPPLPSMPELIARVRESESPVEANHGNEIANSAPENTHEDLQQERSEVPSLEAANPGLLTDNRESRRKLPRAKRIAEEARHRREAKQRVENIPRAAQEFENDFTQTQSGDDLFDDNDNGELAPFEGCHAPLAATGGGGPNQSLPSTNSPTQALKRKQFACPARQDPYQHPIEKGQEDRDPPVEKPSNALPVPRPLDGSIERKREAANKIRERRPPITASPRKPFNDLVIFRVWTGTRWMEQTRVAVDQSDPLRCEREAKRFVEAYYAQLRDARLRILRPSQCLESARQDGSQSVFLIFPEDPAVNKGMEEAAAAFIGISRR